MDSNSSTNGIVGGRHGCGKCFTSFATPEQLQNHCLTCFSDPANNAGSSAASIDSADDDTIVESMNVDSVVSDEELQTGFDYDDNGAGQPSRLDISAVSSYQGHPAFDPEMSKNNEAGGRCIKIVGGKKIMQCTLCFKTFTNYNSFKRHRRMHVSGAAFNCRKCGRNFFRRYLWKNHMERNHGIKDAVYNNEDDKLPLSPSSESNYDGGGGQLQVSTKGIVDINYPCYQCDEIFGSKKSFTDHQRNVHSITQFAFPVDKDKNCEDLDENANVKKFDRPASAGIPEPISMKYDSYSTSSSPGPQTDNTRIIPRSVVHSDDDVKITDDGDSNDDSSDGVRKIYRCVHCEDNFTSRADFRQHQKLHLGVKLHRCEFCCLRFYRAESLTNHLNQHKDNAYCCHVCKKRTGDGEQLREHYVTNHKNGRSSVSNDISEEDEEIRKFGDDIIVVHPEPVDSEMIDISKDSSTSVLAEVLANAVNQRQEGAPPSLRCSVCCRYFRDKNQFLHHVKTHTELQCGYCGKLFLDRNQLSEHQLEHHLNLDKHKCNLCFAIFSNADELRNHVNSHHPSAGSASNYPAKLTVRQLLNRKAASVSSTQRVDDLLRNRGLLLAASNLPSTKHNVLQARLNLNDDKVSTASDNVSNLSSSSSSRVQDENASGVDSKKSKSNVCHDCGKDFVRQELLQRHMILHHSFKQTTPSILARECRKAKAIKSISRKQIASDGSSSASKSTEAKPQLPSSDGVKKQLSNRHVDAPNSEISVIVTAAKSKEQCYYKCRYCLKSFQVLHSLNRHLSEHFVPYFCEFCGMPFQSKADLLSHMNAVHARAQKYYCYACCKNLSGRSELSNHMTVCYGPSMPSESANAISSTSQSFGTYKECKTCHKKFVNEKRLMNHSCIAGDEGMWACDLCNCSFPRSSHLASHQQQAHKCEDVYRCDVCGLAARKEIIITHMVTVHMTKVSSNQSSNLEKANSLTITPIPYKLTKSSAATEYRRNDSTVQNQFQAKNKEAIESELEISCIPIENSGVDCYGSKRDPSGTELEHCGVCNKMLPSENFAEHMLREHCGEVKIYPSNQAPIQFKSAPKSNLSDKSNVIEIITKDDNRYSDDEK